MKANFTGSTLDPLKIVNVASVPKRSPFRYPGGKTWLIPLIRKWLLSLSPRASELIEPFAGGAIVGLTAAFERLAEAVILVERDQDVGAVRQAIFNSGDGPWLANRIAEFEFSPEAVPAELETSPLSLRERAFRTIVRNRVQRGGNPGARRGRDEGGRKWPRNGVTLVSGDIETADPRHVGSSCAKQDFVRGRRRH